MANPQAPDTVRKMRRAKAFTLLEMIIVTIVITILIALGAYSYTTVSSRLAETDSVTTLRSIASAQDAFYAARGGFVSFTDPELATLDGVPEGITFVAANQEPEAYEVSISTFEDNAVTPVLGLATLSTSGACILRAGYASVSSLPYIEVTRDLSEGDCSGDAAVTELDPTLTSTDVSGLLVPQAMSVAAGAGQNTLTWTPQNGTNYIISVTCIPGADLEVDCASPRSYTVGPTGLFTDTNLSPGVTYTYTVSATRLGETSDPAGPASATPFSPDQVGVALPPRDVSATVYSNVLPASHADCDAEETCITLTWIRPSSDINVFRVYRDGALISDAIPATSSFYSYSYTDTTADPGQRYTYSVGANFDGSRLPATDAMSSDVTVSNFPLAVTGLTATPGSSPACPADSCADLSWSNPSAASVVTSYRIFVNGVRADTTVGLTATLERLSPGVVITVQPVSSAGPSPFPLASVTFTP